MFLQHFDPREYKKITHFPWFIFNTWPSLAKNLVSLAGLFLPILLKIKKRKFHDKHLSIAFSYKFKLFILNNMPINLKLQYPLHPLSNPWGIWDGAFELVVTSFSSIIHMFQWSEQFKSKESALVSKWLRKTIFTPYNDSYKQKTQGQ